MVPNSYRNNKTENNNIRKRSNIEQKITKQEPKLNIAWTRVGNDDHNWGSRSPLIVGNGWSLIVDSTCTTC